MWDIHNTVKSIFGIWQICSMSEESDRRDYCTKEKSKLEIFSNELFFIQEPKPDIAFLRIPFWKLLYCESLWTVLAKRSVRPQHNVFSFLLGSDSHRENMRRKRSERDGGTGGTPFRQIVKYMQGMVVLVSPSGNQSIEAEQKKRLQTSCLLHLKKTWSDFVITLQPAPPTRNTNFSPPIYFISLQIHNRRFLLSNFVSEDLKIKSIFINKMFYPLCWQWLPRG